MRRTVLFEVTGMSAGAGGWTTVELAEWRDVNLGEQGGKVSCTHIAEHSNGVWELVLYMYRL